MLGGRRRSELMAAYVADHQNPVNKRFHLIGIPTVAVAVIAWIAAPFTEFEVWPWALALSIIGVALQLVGHRFEGKPPSASSDWRFLIIGLIWWINNLRGKA